MKKLFILLLLAFIPMFMNAQDKQAIVPGNGHIDLEQFEKGVNTSMDISKLSLLELRALKYAPGARQGELIMESDIRQLYMKTSWYYDKASERYWAENPDNVTPLKLSGAEKHSSRRLKNAKRC